MKLITVLYLQIYFIINMACKVIFAYNYVLRRVEFSRKICIVDLNIYNGSWMIESMPSFTRVNFCTCKHS